MKPILGITMGDPCGIGPEITVKALTIPQVYEACKPLVVGSAKVLMKAAKLLNSNVEVNIISSVEDAQFTPGMIDVWDQDLIDIDSFVPGVVNAAAGNAAFQAVKKVIELALNEDIDATITGPLNKEALNLAGWKYNGHTEIYADLTDTKSYAMMLADGDLRVIHISTHVSLLEACKRCKKTRVLEVIRLAHAACINLGINSPRIAVAGLNPHAGENGLFGNEEIQEISPAIEIAQSEGIDVQGPFPPDTIFSKALGGMYDIVVVQYHDQGHIPMKVLGFQYDKRLRKWKSVNGVNVTLGLPIIRCSVDHGTAFDQAWKGTATCDSLLSAMEYGTMMAKNANKIIG